LRRDAGADVHANAADVLASKFDLAGVNPGADLDAEGLDGVSQRARAGNRTAGAVERAQAAVADELDDRPACAADLATDDRVVAVKQIAPTLVAELGG
jgi:hypothetical protein